MNEKEFKKLLKQKENKDIEFKLKLPEPKKVAQLMTALYNARGGKIILGIEDETKNPVGLVEPQKTEHKFTQIIRHWCRLDEQPEIEFVKYKNKDFIVIHCPKGRDTPYFVRGEHIPRVRIGSSNMHANKEEIARLYREGSSKSQDIYPVEKANLDDLDLKTVENYLKKSDLTRKLDRNYLTELMLKEHFIVKENGQLIPTIAGILLFGKNTYLDMHHSEVKADRYVGDTRVEWLDRRDIRGTLFDIIKQAEKFFLRNMRTPAKVVGFKTEVRTEYPIDALREAVINALVHRDWHNQETILIRMYNSFVEIISPGELLRPITVDKIKKNDYMPKTRNKIIAGVLNNLEIMDKRGTGFLRIREDLGKWELPPPEFEEKQGWFIVRFRNPNVERVIDTVKFDLNERQKKALKYIKVHKKITSREYMEINNIGERTARNDIRDLVEKKLLQKIGVTQATYYIIQHSATFGNIRQNKKKRNIK